MHAREYTAVTNQWVNSYKRLFPQPLPDRITESPAYVCWGHLNRSALVRVPAYGKPNSARVEVRSLDSACNPYLAFAVMLGAGLEGIEEGYELPPGPRTTCGRSPPPSERPGYEPLPENLAEAIEVMSARSWWPRCSASTSSITCCATSAPSGRQYRREVTPYERRRYLSL